MSITSPRVRSFPTAFLIVLIACLAGFASPAKAAFSLDSLTAAPTNTAAGAYSDFVKTLNFGNDSTVRSLRIDFAKGQLGAVDQATACPTATWNSNPENCGNSAIVGYVDNDVTALGFLPQGASGNIYRLQATGTEVMRIGMYVTTGLASPMKIIGVARLRDDYGLRVTVDDIPSQAQILGFLPGGIRIDKMTVRMYGRVNNGNASANGFFFNPAECVAAQTTILATGHNGQTSSKTSTYTPTDCAGVPFSPRVEFLPSASGGAAPASSPAAFTVRVSPQTANYAANAARQAAPFRATSLVMPEGIQLTGASDSDGNLAACTDAQFGYGTSAPVSCPAGADVGDVVMASPLVGDVSGQVYLAQPETGPGHENEIIRLFMVAQRGSQADALRVKLRAKVDMNPVTKRMDVSLVDLPAQPIKNFTFTFRAGGAPATRSPRLCGTYPGTAALTGFQSATAVNVSADYAVTTNCPPAGSFRPALGASTVPQTAGAPSTMTTNIDLPIGDEPMDKVTVSLPKGLLANIKDVPMCTRAQVAAANCPAASEIGTVAARAGQVATPGQFDGKVYLAEPAPAATGAIAGLYMKVPVSVGPIFVDTINVDAAVKLRSDFGLDVISPIPSELRKMNADIQRLQIVFNKANFMVNPPVCTSTTASGAFTSTLNTNRTATSAMTFTGCATQPFDPTISFSASPASAGGASAFTARIQQPATGIQAPPSAITMRLPDGVSLSPSAGSSGIAGCSDAQFAKTTFADPSCPAPSEVGTVTIQTPSIGQMSGKAYLGTAVAGHTARLLVDAKSDAYGNNARVKLEGLIDVNETTGQVTTVFTDIPPARFTDFQLTLRGGSNPVLSMPRTCGTYGGSATLTPHGGGSAVNRSANLTVDQNCGDSASFDPTLTNVVSPTTAGSATTMTTTIQVPQRHRALDRMQLRLPAGLLGKIDGAPRCTIAQANAGTCAASTEIGDVLAQAGQGAQPGSFPGKLYLTDAPNAQSIVGIAVKIPAVVGPIDLGNVITIASVQLRSADYGLDVTADVPTSVKGIPLHMQRLSLEINKTGFLQNPSNCSVLSTGATLRPQGGTAVDRSVPFQATDCAGLQFDPAVSFSASPAAAGGASEFTTRITAPASARPAALKTAVVDLPTGVALSSSINSAGNLTGCTAAQFDRTTFSDPACAATTELGTATLQVPQVGALTGKVYLADTAPAGAIAGLYLDAASTQFGDSVRVKLTGKVEVDEATGKTTATFDDAPSVPFTSFELTLRGGDAPALSMPRTCGTTSGTARLTPHGAAAVNRNGSLVIDDNCGDAGAFAPTASVTMTPATAGSFTDLRTQVAVPAGHRELAKMVLRLPSGLLANVDGLERCTVAQAQAGTCAAATKIGTITTKAGQGAVGGTFSGDAFLVDAVTSDHILSIGLSLDIQVGPIDLGKVNVVAPVTLRDDYGLDVTADVPTRVKGIPIYLRELTIDVTRNDFLFTPSRCGDKTTTIAMTSAAYAGDTSTQSRTSTQEITDCDDIAFAPTVAFSASPARAGGASAFTTTVSMPAGNAALKTATVRLPDGVSLSPSANSAGDLTGCTDAQFDRAVPFTAPSCPAASKIGTTTIDTAVVGELTGDVYLAATAPAGKLARVFVNATSTEFPGAAVKMVGEVAVDEETGATTAVFDDAPEVPFNEFAITFRGGTAPVISMPRTCGTPSGAANFVSWGGGSGVDRTATLTVNQDCSDANSFAPTFSTTFSPMTAGANTSMTMNVAVPERHRAIDRLDFSLPAGLLANIDGAPRCSLTDAAAGNCTAATKIGDVTATSGQGSQPGSFNGALYLTDAPDAGSIVGIAVEIRAQVGPIDLGKIVTIADVELRQDYGIDVSAPIPTVHKGIPLYVRTLEIEVNRSGFMTNPVTCGARTVDASLRPQGGTAVTRSSAYQATNCAGLAFNPTVAFSASPKRAAGPSSFTTTITAPGTAGQAALKTAVVDLPSGVALSSSIDGAGTLAGCTAGQFNQNDFSDPACAAVTELGSAELEVRQVGTLAGKVYLAQTTPAGALAGLYLDAKSTQFGASVRVKLAGKVVVDEATGKTTATFDDAPAVPFTSFKMTLRGGDSPVISMPRTCGTTSGAAALTTQAGTTVDRSGSLVIDENCGDAAAFGAGAAVSVTNPKAGDFTGLRTTFTVPAGHRELEKIALSLPAGLLANVDGLPRCSVAAAQAGACGVNTKVGTVTAQAGQGDGTGTFTGDVFLVDAPTSADLLALGISLNVQVGPIDLGKVNVIAPVKLRDDYGLDIAADVPTQVKGIPIYLRQLVIDIAKDEFMFAPSTCGTKTATAGLISKSYGGSTSTANASSTITIEDCDEVGFDPAVAFSAQTPDGGGANAFTTRITMPAGDAALKTATVTLPAGMSLSPSANSDGQLAGCTDAQFGKAAPAAAPTCNAASRIGEVTIDTAAVGELTGRVYLAQTAPAGKIARVFVHAASTDFPGAGVKMTGTVEVDEATGTTTAVFDDAPEVPFRSFEISFRGGESPVLSMPRVCGTYGGSATLASYAGGDAAERNASLALTQGCTNGANNFAPTFSNTFAPTKAGADTDMHTVIGVPEGHMALDRLVMRLPAGTLANIDGAPRCTLAQANAGSCPAATKLGDISAKSGQGPRPGDFAGALYLTEPRNAQSVVGIAVEIAAVVGPIDLGKIITIADVELRQDYGIDITADVPTSHKGIPLYVRELTFDVTRSGFMTNPVTCGATQTSASLRPQEGNAVNRGSAFQATDCDELAFEPVLGFSADPARAGGPAEFTTTITAPGTAGQAALKTAVVDLPSGVALSSSINAAGDLTGCTAGQFKIGDFTDPDCAATSAIGTTEIDVRQVGRLSGKVYLAQTTPAGAIAGLYVDAKSDEFGEAVRVKLAGKVEVDEATGKTTATFDDAPAIPFSRFALKLRGGDSPAVSMPRTCGTTSGAAALTPQTGAAVNRSASLTIDDNCGEATKFEPTAAVAVNPTGAGKFTELRTTFTVPSGQRELSELDIALPAGLLANVDGRERCTIAQAQAGDCAASTKIGTVSAKAGQGADGGSFGGDVFLVDPADDDEILSIGISLNVQVGPIDLGKVNVVAPVVLRDDYGLDIHAEVPTRVKGIPIYLRQLVIDITKNDFMFNPSTCGARTSTIGLKAGATAVTRTAQFTVTDCDQVDFEPEIAFSAAPGEAGKASAFTTRITLPGGNAALQNATVRLPDGVSLSPSAASSAALEGCTDAQYDKAVPAGPVACPAASKIGSTKVSTPAVGELTGDVYLAETAPAGAIARVFVHATSEQFPGAGMKLVGTVVVDEATGETSAVFTDAPEVPFTQFDITFRGGDSPVLSMPRTCGDFEGSASFLSYAGGTPATTDAELAIDECPDAESFDPSLTNTVSPATAGSDTAMTTRLAVPAGHRALDELELKLPAGLLANVDGRPTCELDDARASACPANTKIGSVSATAGQGTPGTFTGSLYLTEAPQNGDVVGIAVDLRAVVGPIDLGRIVTIASAQLRPADYGLDISATVPTRHKGIPLHLRTLELQVDEPGFMTNPSVCADDQRTSAVLHGGGAAESVTRHAPFAITGCDELGFDPELQFTAAPPRAAGASSLTTRITMPASGQKPMDRAVVELPAGVALSSSINSGGDLVGCTAAQFDQANFPDPSCAPGSVIGQATIQVPQVGTLSGDVYLAQEAPAGAIAGLYVDAKSATFGASVRVKIAGRVDVDEASGTTTATFADLPSVAFSSFALTLRGGDKPAISMPRTCGDAAGSGAFTPQGGGSARSDAATLAVTDDCGESAKFEATGAVALSSAQAGKFSHLTTTITVPSGQRELRKVEISLPAGLLANVDGLPTCAVADAENGACAANTKIGSVSAKAGQGATGGTFTGDVHLTAAPQEGDLLGLGITLDAVVGPIDLGKINVVAPVRLRSDYGLDIEAAVPTRVKGIPIYLRQLAIAIDKDEFLFNPSTCGPKTTQLSLTSALYGEDRSTADATSTTTITDCDQIDFEPTIGFSADPARAGGSGSLTTVVAMPTGTPQSALKNASVVMPAGVSLSPSIDQAGDLTGCTAAQFDRAEPGVTPACPPASKVGSAKIQTASVGELTGDVYLAADAAAGQIARVYVHAASAQFPGAGVKLVGDVDVDEATGRVAAVFTDAPEVPFTRLELTFRGGDAPVLSLPRTCGTTQGTAAFTSHAGGAPVNASGSLVIDEHCDAPGFDPVVETTTAPSTASAPTALTTKITVPAGSQELDRVQLRLPTGLLANIKDQERCSVADAEAGDCAAATRIGTLQAKAGQGSTGATYGGGSVYLTERPSAGALVGLAIELPVQVGKVGQDPVIDLGTVTQVGSITLRQDYGIDIDMAVPTRHKGIPLYLREFTLAIDKAGFMTNPATCDGNATTGTLHSAQNGTKAVNAALAITGCDSVSVTPTVGFSASPSSSQPQPAGSAPALTTTLGVAGANPAPLAAATVVLPRGVSLTASANAAGDLTGCTDAQFAKASWADPTCAPGSRIGEVTIDTPSVGEVSGHAYLAATAPAGKIARLLIDAESATFGDQARIKIEGLVEVAADGTTTAEFSELPAVAFHSFALTLRGGDKPVVSLPRTCGAAQGSATVQAVAGGSATTANGNLTLASCPPADQFAPTVDLDLQPSGAGANGQLTTTVTIPGGDQELERLRIDMPEGLTAKLQGVPRCELAQAEADACPANTELGTVAAKVGVSGAPFTQNGKAYLTKGRNGHIAGMALILDAKVGPIDLGKVITIADIDLRSPDLAMRVTSDVPTTVKGVRLDVRELEIAITRNGFLVNPSSCGTVPGSATLTGKQGATQSRTPSVEVDCAGAPQAFEPELEFGASNPKTGEASTFTTKVTAGGSGAKSPFKAISITLPEGMSMSASAGARGDLAGCTDAQFKQDRLNEASECPEGAKIGTVKFDTSLVGELTGDAFLAPATSGNLARLFLETKADPAEVENLTVRLVGEVRVDAATGATRVVFDEVPAIPVDTFEVTMRGGDAPVLSMPRTCGAAQGSGVFTPVNGATEQDDASLQVTDCPDPVPFDPTVALDRSTTKAGESIDFTTTVAVPAKSQELRGLDMTLPAGLLGKISSVPACALAVAQQGDCAPESQVGTVSAKTGVHSAPFTVSGKVYLVKGDANSIARLAIVLPAQVGPIDLGNVVTIAELKLRADYGLTITAPEIPTRVKGVRLDVSEFQLSIDRDDFMVNPVSCGNAPASATVRSAQNGSRSRNLTLTTTDCGDLKLDASVGWGANPASPLAASAVTTTIAASAGGDALDAMKSVRVTMPEQMSLSASAGARGDLAECTPGQFGAGDIDTDAACPAGSRIGSVVIDSPMVGELTGDAYLGAKTGGHFAGLYLQAKAPEYPSLRVKIAGWVDVDEATGRMTAGFDDLPQVQVSRIALTLRGGDAPVITLPRTCGDFGGNVSIQRFGGGTSTAGGALTLNADCPDPGAFAPALGLAVGTPQAGAATSLTTAVAVPARHGELSSMQIVMPRGLLGKLTAVPLCDVASAQAGNCGEASSIGSVTAKVGTAGAPFTVRGTAYMTQGYDGAIAGLMIKLPAKVGPIDLGDVVTMAKIELVGNDLQMVITAPSIPTRVKGIPLNLSELVIGIDRPGVIVNASQCADAAAGANFGSAQGGQASATAPYAAQNCGGQPWNPAFGLDFSGPAADLKKNGHPTITTVIGMTEGHGNLRKADVLLPAGVSTDLKNINARVCASAADAAAGNCPASAVLGPVSVVTPALGSPLNGQSYLVRVPGEVLPGIFVRIRDQIAFDVLGTTRVNSAGRVQVLFDGMPDTPITQLRLVFNGGANGVISLSDEICGQAPKKTEATLTAQHGAAKGFALPISCNGSNAPQQNLNSAETTNTVISMKPTGSSSTMTFALSNPNGIRRITVTMPKGAIFTKKAKKYVKPKLTGDKAKVKVTNGDRRLRITITPSKKDGKVTKVKFTLPKKAIKINIKVRKILNNKKLKKKKRDAQLKKVLTPKVELLDGLGKTVKVPVKLTVKASTKVTKSKKSKKKSLGPVSGTAAELPGTPDGRRVPVPAEQPAAKPQGGEGDAPDPTTPVE